jgi:hypothetical protein
MLQEVKMKHITLILTLIMISFGALAGCQTAQPVMDPTPNNILVTVQPQATDQAGGRVPPPARAPVRPNASLATVEVLSLTPSKDRPDTVIVHVLVKTTAPAEGLDEYNPDLTGQEIDINLAAGEAANLVAGDVISLTLSYRGDEWGGGYYGTMINNLER